MVELIVVLLVLGILATLAVMSLMGWQDYADFKQNNEFAQNIFSAAQIQLTQYGERGQLSELIDAVTDSNRAAKQSYLLSSQSGLRDSNGDIYDVENIWQDGNKGSIYYLKAKKGDYEIYLDRGLKDESASDMRNLSESEDREELRRIKALFDMIDPYIADKSMLDAAICIEFDPDPKTALVYSVFYNGNADEFTYEDGNASAGTRRVSIKDRSARKRRIGKTGYYGAEIMAKGTDTFISRPVITNLRLNNEDTLNLTWSTKGNGTDLTGMIYNINLYEAAENQAGDGTRLVSLVLGSADAADLDDTLAVAGGRIRCVVNNAVTGESGQEYWFPVIHDKSAGTLTLVLDGLDLSADENTTLANLKETASIRRFALNAENIYAAISGSRPGVYDMTVEKRSNTEHQLFGGRKILEDGSVVYDIENARHLNNVRFKEKEYETDDGAEICYQITRDISWEYVLNQETVYDEGIVQRPGGDVSGFYFRPLETLRKNSVLESNDSNKTRSLKRFRMDIGHMELTAGENPVIGLVARNKGTIRNLILEDVYVNGAAENLADSADSTGAFCGESSGILYNLKVQDSGMLEKSRSDQYNQVRGYTHVGGIVGRAVAAERNSGDLSSEKLVKLVNRIAVTGQKYVGGIAGSITVLDGMVTVDSCENYGKVRGEIQDAETGAYFFGGIVGSAEETPGMAGAAIVRNCVSSPYYTEQEAEKLLDDIKNPETNTLIENFVGGIAGFNDTAIIENCSTVRESANKQGYIVGRDFVGGIVGYNAGTAGELAAGEDNNRNQAHVIGHSYVGGIVGCNMAGHVDKTKEPYTVVPAKTGEGMPEADRAVVKGWINEGIITATGNYVGGITGFNGDSGLIENSYSNVDYDGSLEHIAKVSTEARFSGGVAGYNQGELVGTGTDQVSVVSVVNGKDYVGGVVGCNDIGGKISNYALKGGYIEGKHFVGGYVGLNMEKSIFSKDRIISNPNRVTGEYFVGGVIGGNLVPIEEKEGTRLTAHFETDNFLGDLVAEQGAFVGGFIGYNYLLDESVAGETVENNASESGDGVDALQPEISKILYETNVLCGKLEPLSDEDVTLADPEKKVRGLLSDYENSKAEMLIQGIDSSNTAGQELLGSIRAKIYVGGVVGYNHPGTALTIQDVENVTPVEATGYIKAEEGVSGNTHYYSYAGGIIGKVEQNVTLDRCRNRDVGDVRTKGTYTGGLAEINYGTIRNSQTGNIGDGTRSYVGGLVGVNAAKKITENETEKIVQGTITDCIISGQISGVSYVGGLAAENYGIIEYMDSGDANEATVDASGSFVGGIVGYAHKGGEIRLNSTLDLDINVTGSAAYVGGIAGVNSGTITVSDGKTVRNKKDNVIIGRMHVGGFIGMQTEPDGEITLSGFSNYALVQASSGYAGGIAAIVRGTKKADSSGDERWTSKVTLKNCENHGSVEVLSAEDTGEDQDIPEEPLDPDMPEGETGSIPDEGDIPDEEDEIAVAAGGITAVNYGSIVSCVNIAEVKAGDGYMGGIAAVNYNTVENSEVGSEGSETDLIELTGGRYVGGIAALNAEHAVIEHCAVKNLILYNQADSDDGCMGGVTAQNLGEVRNCQVGVSFDATVTTTQETEKYKELRMEAAKNAFEGSKDNRYSLIKDGRTLGYSVALVSNATDTAMGGIAGINDGSGKIKGNYKHDTDYSVVSADLSFANKGTSYYGNMGGIAGANYSEISGYEFSGYVHGEANNPARSPEFNVNYDLEPTGNEVYGYGGIAGVNGSDQNALSASIRNCYLGMVKVQGSGDASNRANVGGVAGFNGIGGSVSDIVFSQQSEVLSTKQSPFSYEVKKTPVKKTFEGTVWVNAETYGHVGGVVGYNHGTISNINWNGTYAEKTNRTGSTQVGDQYFPGGKYAEKVVCDVDSTGALITAKAGHIGGIAGYNRRSGSISDAVTGKDWLVYAASQEQDNGTGGIIGYNISEKDLQRCDNHATVVKMSGNAVGGIVGRNENGTTSSWRFMDCRNYGKVYAQARAGGIVGNWKYKGGTLEQCINYGTVSANSDGVGGILGRTYGISAGESINIVKCENHGEVTGIDENTDINIPVGGILGHGYENQKIYISGCINTGMIADEKGNTSSGGILGKADNYSAVEIVDCHNYGYSKNGNSQFCGITPANVTLKGCFGITSNEGMYPIRSQKTEGNYYFAKDEYKENDDFWVHSIVAVDTGGSDNRDLLWKTLSGSFDTQRGNFYFKGGKRGSLAFEFNRPVKLDTVTITWPSDKDRNTTYSIQFMNGNKPVQLSGTEGTIIQADRVSGVQVYNLGGQTVTGVNLNGIFAKNSDGTDNNAAIFQFAAKSEGDGTMLRSKDPSSKDPSVPGLLYNATLSGNKTVCSTGWTSGKLVIKQENGKNYAVSAISRQLILKDLADYGQSEIEDERRKTDSALSYILCKGTSERKGLDGYLIPSEQDNTPSVPQNVEKSAENGAYRISWDPSEYAQYYVATCRYQTEGEPDAETLYVTYSNSVLIPASMEKNGKAAERVTVTIVACSGENISASSAELTFLLGHPLVYPQIRYRLKGLGDTKMYYVTLENRDEYEEFVKKYLFPEGKKPTQEEIDAELEKIKIYAGGLEKITFTARSGGETVNGTEVLHASSTNNNIMFNCYAVYEKGGTAIDGAPIEPSLEVIRESMCPRQTDYEQQGNPTEKLDGRIPKFANVEIEKTAVSNSVGFSGVTAKELAYNIKLSRGGSDDGNSWVVDYRSELVADDPALKVPVAFSTSEQTRISPSSSVSSLVKLSNLPEDFLTRETDAADGKEKYRYQNVMVRTYPTKMSNDVVYQGWKVADGKKEKFTAEELKEMTVSDKGSILSLAGGSPNLISGTDVKKGYVIVWNGTDGAGNSSYKLYYNALLRGLEENEAYQPVDNDKTPADWKYKKDSYSSTYMKYQIFYHFIDLEKEIDNIQPEPVIYANAGFNPTTGLWEDGDYDGSSEFVLTWDQAAADSRPAYTGDRGEEFYNNASYRLTVTGIKDGKETVLVNNEEFNTEKRTGAYNTYKADPSRVSTWDYDSIRVSLTRLGTVKNNVTTKFPSTAEKTLLMRKRLTQVKDVKIALKKNSDGVVMKDGLDYVISFAGVVSEEEKAALKCYRITIASRETEHPSPTQIKETEDPNAGATDVDVNLAQFRRDEKIVITVQAIAKDDGKNDHTGYRDGLVSAPREMTVPNRLFKPQMGPPTENAPDNLTRVDPGKDPEDEYRDTLSVQEFAEGCITLQMKKETYTDQNLRYQIALELYNSMGEAENGKHPIDTGTDILPTKENPEEMQYNSAQGYHTYVLKELPSDYAGKWLRVVLRSVGTNSISSLWTDDDTDEGNKDEPVEPFMVFQLPNIRIDAVEFAELAPDDTEDVLCEVMNAGEKVPGIELTATQQLIAFDMTEHASKYHIIMVQTPQQADKKADGSNADTYQVSDVNDMMIEENADGTYKLTCWSTEGADAGSQPTQVIDHLSVGGDAEPLIYREAISVDIGEKKGNYIETTAAVQLIPDESEKTVRVVFRLPDCQDITDSVSTSLGVQKRTEQILVQSITSEDNDNYLDSKWAMLYWEDDALSAETVLDMKKEAVEPGEITVGDTYEAETTTAHPDVAYEWKGFTGTVRMLVSVSDSTGHELGVFGVPVFNTVTTDNAKQQQVWLPNGFAKYEDRNLKLKFRSIFDAAGNAGGLSDEYTGEYLLKLPELPETYMTAVVSGLSDVKEYPVKLSENSGSAGEHRARTLKNSDRIRLLTVRQKQLAWEYDLTDTKTTGYKLQLGGNQMESAYRLSIDLHRELFGTMPGLEDYLAEDGKLLYTVSYNVDGEMLLQWNPDVGSASPSDADPGIASPSDQKNNYVVATDSNMATASNSQEAIQPDVLTLECRLKAVYVMNGEEVTGIRFMLTLPDVSYDYLEEDAAELYAAQFSDGLYQTEEFTLTPVMINRYYRKEDTVLDLTELRGELEDDLSE